MTKKRKTDGKGEKEVGEVQTEGDFSLRLSSVVTLTSLVERVGPLLPAHTAQVLPYIAFKTVSQSVVSVVHSYTNRSSTHVLLLRFVHEQSHLPHPSLSQLAASRCQTCRGHRTNCSSKPEQSTW